MSTPRQIWIRRWLNGPGVGTGYYAWGKSTLASMAHCYRTGSRTEHALCGYAFGKQVTVPAWDDGMCEECKVKAESMEREIAVMRPETRKQQIGRVDLAIAKAGRGQWRYARAPKPGHEGQGFDDSN
jgi:hypothetical protein